MLRGSFILCVGAAFISFACASSTAPRRVLDAPQSPGPSRADETPPKSSGPTEAQPASGPSPQIGTKDWQESCPDGEAVEVEFAPTFVVGDLSDLYEPLYGDFMEQFGEGGAGAPRYSVETKRSIVCTVVNEGFWGILEPLRKGSFVSKSPPDCLDQDELSASFGRFTYQILRLDGSRYLAARTAEMPGPSANGIRHHRVTARAQGKVVVTEVVTDAYRCPLDREDPCRELEQDDGTSKMLCFDDETECLRAEFDSEIYLTNPLTGKHVKSGLFHRRPVPSVRVGADHAVIDSAECSQVASLP